MSEQKRIQFSQNWNNKLQCHYFTTVRKASTHYVLDEEYVIELKGQYYCRARVVGLWSIGWNEFSDHLAYTDAGMPVSDFRKMLANMYKHTVPDVTKCRFFILLLKRLDTTGHPNQASIFDTAA